MNLVDILNQRALGFGLKKDDRLVDLRLKNLQKHTLLNVADGPLMNVAFDPSNKSNQPRIAVGHEEGQVSVHNLNHENKVQGSFRVQNHLNCIYDLVWSPDGEHIYTACGDGTVGYHQVEAKTSYISTQHVQYFTTTSTSMKSVVAHPIDCNIFATGSSDGNIFVWDTRVLCKPDITIKQAYSKETKRKGGPHVTYPTGYINSNSIRSMVFQDDHTLISSCSESPHVKIWDLRRTYCNLKHLPKPLHSLDAPGYVTGFSCLALDVDLMRLYARAQDSTIQIYDVGTYNKLPVSEIPAPSNGKLISFHIKIKLSPDGRHLVAGSSSGVLNLWNTKTGAPLFEQKDEPAFEELTGVDWIQTRDKETLICGGSEDGDLCVWTEAFAQDVRLTEDPPALNIQFSQLQIKPKPRRPKTPPRIHFAANDPSSVISPTLNLPSFVEDPSSHPVSKTGTSSSKTRTPNNWLVNLRREITPKRSPSTDSVEKSKGKRSRRRLNSSPGMSLTDFMQHHCKVPRLDSENHPLNS